MPPGSATLCVVVPGASVALLAVPATTGYWAMALRPGNITAASINSDEKRNFVNVFIFNGFGLSKLLLRLLAQQPVSNPLTCTGIGDLAQGPLSVWFVKLFIYRVGFGY